MGGKKQNLPTVVERPIGCPVCEHTEAIVVNVIRQRNIEGLEAGKPYNRVTWRRVKCQSENCGQVYIKRSYRMI